MCNLNTGAHRHSQPSRKHYYAHTRSPCRHMVTKIHASTHAFKKKYHVIKIPPEQDTSHGNSVRHTCHSSHNKPVPSPLHAHAHGILVLMREQAITCVITDYYWQNTLLCTYTRSHMNIHIYMHTCECINLHTAHDNSR